MILHTAQIVKIGHWSDTRQFILNAMRANLVTDATRRDLDLGPELIEVVHIRHNGKSWVSANPGNCTHVKVTMESEGEHR